MEISRIGTIIFLFFFYIRTLNGYDIELEGKLHLSDDFVNKMKTGGAKPEELAQSLIQEVETMILNSRKSPLESMNIKIPYDLASVFHKALASRRSSLDKDFTSEGESISRFIVYLKEKAVKRIRTLSKVLKKNFHFSVLSPMGILKINSNYLNRMKSYLNVILNEKFDNDLEKEFLLMDIVETSNKILYSEARILLNTFIDENYATVGKEDTEHATQKIYSKYVESKKEDYKFLCSTLNLCRPFPAYSDYAAELLSELLKAPDHKFRKILSTSRQVLGSALGTDSIITEMKEHISSKKLNARELLSVLRGIITRRHEWIHNSHNTVSKQTRAIRIFLDIIDKAFENEGELVVAYQFDLTVKSLRDWIASLRNDIEAIFKVMVKFSANILNKNLTPEAKEELRALSEIICHGASRNDSMQQKLFTEGSCFVNP